VAIGGNIEPEEVKCTKWTKVLQKRAMGDLLWGTLKVVQNIALVGQGLRVNCYGVTLKPGLVLCGPTKWARRCFFVDQWLWG